MSSKKGQSKKIDSARRAPSRRGLAGYSAPRRKTPEDRYVFTLYGRRHAARQKTPEGRHIFTLYKRRHRSHTAAENAGRQIHIYTLRAQTRSAAENAERQASLRTLQHRHRSHTAAEMSDSGYNSIFCKHHLIQQKKRRMTACPPIPPKNLRRPLITPKNTAIFIGFFFYTSPGYAAESPCFRHKHTPSFRNTFFAARITICFTIIDFPSCFFSAAAV